MDDARRDRLAKTLSAHARIVAAVVRRRRVHPPLLDAIRAAQTMVELSEDVLHAVVEDARTAGHTWHEIGEVLGTTRQAAFQRFSRDS